MAGFGACDNVHLVRRTFSSPAAWLALAFLVGFHPGNEVVVVADDAVEARVESPFSCQGRPYGFYADPAHGCRGFHICNPQMIDGKMDARIYSYYCPGDWVFDQLRFACTPPNATRPEACEEAERLYVINEAFTLRTKVLASRVSKRRFSCDRITPGTYADMRSGCKSYFVCAFVDGREVGVRLSCPMPTVFDQRTNTCIFPDLATPCELSEMYFNVPDYESIKLTSKPTPMVNLSPRGNRRLPRMPMDSVYRSPVGNKLLSSEAIMDGLGVKHIMAKHAVTASNGHTVLEAPPFELQLRGSSVRLLRGRGTRLRVLPRVLRERRLRRTATVPEALVSMRRGHLLRPGAVRVSHPGGSPAVLAGSGLLRRELGVERVRKIESSRQHFG
ncbi:hypothetical protein MTO96_036084 [Rhipicephalus appendiculatus]